MLKLRKHALEYPFQLEVISCILTPVCNVWGHFLLSLMGGSSWHLVGKDQACWRVPTAESDTVRDVQNAELEVPRFKEKFYIPCDQNPQEVSASFCLEQPTCHARIVDLRRAFLFISEEERDYVQPGYATLVACDRCSDSLCFISRCFHSTNL